MSYFNPKLAKEYYLKYSYTFLFFKVNVPYIYRLYILHVYLTYLIYLQTKYVLIFNTVQFQVKFFNYIEVRIN